MILIFAVLGFSILAAVIVSVISSVLSAVAFEADDDEE